MVALVQVTLRCRGHESRDRSRSASSSVDPLKRAEVESRATAALAGVRAGYLGRPRATIQRAITTALTDAVGSTLTGTDLARAATAIHHGHYLLVDVDLIDRA